MQIEGKTALVTGGASGLGAATVRRFHALRARVVIADLNREAGGQLQEELGSTSRFVETDVTQEASLKSAVAAACEHFDSIHILVNCAGVGLAEKILGSEAPHDLERFSKVIQVNLVGTFNALRLAAAAMAHNEAGEDGERGVIINTASAAAFEGQIGQAAYSASKGGIVALTLPAARELARYGIRVVTIAPGIFDTPLLAGLPEPARQSLGRQVPFPPRLGHPGEYAALVQHIVENVIINGETIRLDGALRMAPR